MILKVSAAGMIAALLMTSAATAVTVTNRDDKDVKVTIIEGEARQDNVLGAGKVVDGVCQKGCIIRLNDSAGDEYELEGSEVVSIDAGFLYYDGSEVDRASENDGASASGRVP